MLWLCITQCPESSRLTPEKDPQASIHASKYPQLPPERLPALCCCSCFLVYSPPALQPNSRAPTWLYPHRLLLPSLLTFKYPGPSSGSRHHQKPLPLVAPQDKGIATHVGSKLCVFCAGVEGNPSCHDQLPQAKDEFQQEIPVQNRILLWKPHEPLREWMVCVRKVMLGYTELHSP